MKIVVLGADGMLGHDLAASLSSRHQTLAYGHGDVDIMDLDGIRRCVDKAEPDVLINAAAYTAVDQAESAGELAFAVNERGPGNLVEALKGSKTLLVHFSSDYVFDGTKEGAYLEQDPANPLGIYGKSKHAGDKVVIDSGQPHLIIRTAWLYGKHGRNFVHTIQRLAKERSQLKIIDDQTGSPTYTKDLSEATGKLIAKGASGIVHVVNSGSATWYTFAKEILRLSNITDVDLTPCTTKEYPLPAPRPRNSMLDCSRYEQLIGELPRPWTEALADYLRQ